MLRSINNLCQTLPALANKGPCLPALISDLALDPRSHTHIYIYPQIEFCRPKRIVRSADIVFPGHVTYAIIEAYDTIIRNRIIPDHVKGLQINGTPQKLFPSALQNLSSLHLRMACKTTRISHVLDELYVWDFTQDFKWKTPREEPVAHKIFIYYMCNRNVDKLRFNHYLYNTAESDDLLTRIGEEKHTLQNQDTDHFTCGEKHWRPSPYEKKGIYVVSRTS